MIDRVNEKGKRGGLRDEGSLSLCQKSLKTLFLVNKWGYWLKEQLRKGKKCAKYCDIEPETVKPLVNLTNIALYVQGRGGMFKYLSPPSPRPSCLYSQPLPPSSFSIFRRMSSII